MGFWDCVSQCADQACYDGCVQMYPAGAQLYDQLVRCVMCDACYSDCDGTGYGCTPACGADEFACADGSCLPLAQQCDGAAQCPGGEDEQGCGQCDGTGDCFACQECAVGGLCAGALAACQNNTECTSFWDCLSQCQDQACVDVCAQTYPSGAQLYDEMAQCVLCDQCYGDCDGQGYGCAPACGADEFACADGSCLPLAQQCDGAAQCPAGDDEQGCPGQCDGTGDCQTCADCAFTDLCANEVGACVAAPECLSYNDCMSGCQDQACVDACAQAYPLGAQLYDALSQCILCDACVDDCAGSGYSCTPACGAGEFACGDGSCIPLAQRCDGAAQCPAGDDEQGCGQCDGSGDCQTCADCSFQGQCVNEYDTCVASQACLDFDACVVVCQDQACVGACVQSNPEGAQLYYPLMQCFICGQCPSDCASYSGIWC